MRLTKIYTRGGDAGETSLGNGSRVSKLDPRIAAYGTVDELNSAVGLVLATDCPDAMRAMLALKDGRFVLSNALRMSSSARRFVS